MSQVKNSSTADPNKPPVEMPVLLEGLNFTFRTLERRLRQYRYLVFATSVTGLGSIILALVLRRWIILMGELALPLYFVAFLWIDNRLVKAWRRGIFKMRDEQGLNLEQLTKSLNLTPRMPRATLDSMLATLPSALPKHGPKCLGGK